MFDTKWSATINMYGKKKNQYKNDKRNPFDMLKWD